MTFIAIGVLIILLLTGLPIAYSLGLGGLFIAYFFMGKHTLLAIPQVMFSNLDSFILMAVPFFILAGNILLKGNVTESIIDVIESFIGQYKGGLAVATVIACIIFSAISGSSAATVAAIGCIAIPEMIKRGYNRRFTLSLVAASGGLGILIPPSIPMIVYSSITNQSVAKLFLAGATPGILLGMLYIFMSFILTKRSQKAVVTVKKTWGERICALRKASWALMLPVIILGGIYGGVFTPTEAAAVSAAYGFIVSLFIYKGFKPRETLRVLSESASQMSMIMLVVAGAMLFGYALGFLRVPQNVAEFVSQSNISPIQFLLVVNLMLFIMGMFLETISILTLTMPVLFPIILHLGIDPIHFGAIFVVNMELALITPPLGINLYVASAAGKVPVEEVVRGMLPFFLCMVAVLILITCFPQVSLWLPNLLK